MSHVVMGGQQPLLSQGRGAWGLALVIALSVPIACYGLAFPFVPALNPDFHARLMGMPWYASVHFLGSGLALLIGGFQFSARLRQRHLALHRWVGRIYLGAVLVGGIGGLAIAGIAHGGPPTTVGFTMLGALWLYSGARAYGAIRAGDIDGHRRWMVRNFALTFAAVTLRLELGLLTGALGWSFDHAYLTVAWLCWVPNLVVAEWWLLRPAARRVAA
ncbi:MAG: DUF2306 domain-containing protein [Pseudomonadales bacterium]